MTTTTERHLRAMGCDVHLAVVTTGPGTELLDALTARLTDLERRWSRFRPDSDVRVLAAAQGRAMPVTPDTQLLVARMLAAHRATDGWYDPTVGQALVDLGYDRGFDLLGGTGPTGALRGSPVPGMAGVELHDDHVRVPPGVLLDPGSIGKGLAADLLVEVACAAGASGVLVNLGGDVACAGRDDRGAAWGVVVADDARHGAPTPTDPAASGDGDLVALLDAAIVTSTTRRRRWVGTDGTDRHHVVDPRHAAPTTHDLHTVTVLTDGAWWADAAATAALAAGPTGIGLADRLDLCCRLVFDDGTVLDLGGFTDHVVRPSARTPSGSPGAMATTDQ